MRRRPISPKLSPPLPVHALTRERLFALLDEASSASMIWISGPAGAGKSTLVASYLRTRSCRAVWYRFDTTDTDPGTLFEHLAQEFPERRLPSYVDRYRAGAEAFTQHYFRRLFAGPDRGPLTLVLDSAEHAASSALLAMVAEEVPSNTTLVVTSREPPPSAFSRLLLQGRVQHIGWDLLRFTEGETQALIEQMTAESSQSLPLIDAAVLHRRCDGWAAGLRLVLERARGGARWQDPVGAQHNDTLFGYIASEVFAALAPALQDVLLKTCQLPDVSARQAMALSRCPQAGDWLDELASRHVLVDRLQSSPAIYRYHDLFREFLSARQIQAFLPAEIRSLQQQSGELLAAAGRPEHAIGLLNAAGEWSRASQLILDNAAGMMARGHSAALHQWVGALPAWYVDATPRLLYCLGLAQTSVAPHTAMPTLERAYARFDAQDNLIGMALCAAGIVQCYYFRLDDYHGLEHWGHLLAELLARSMDFPSAETELHVRSLSQLALTYRDPAHPALATCARRILALLSRDIEVNQRVVAAAILLPYCDWVEPELSPLVRALIRPLLKTRGLTPFNHLWWLSAEIQHQFCGQQPEAVEEVAGEIEHLVRRHCLEVGAALPLNLALIRQAVGIRPAEPLALPTPTPLVPNPCRRQEGLNAYLYKADLLLREKDPSGALRHAERARQLCRDTGLIIAEMESLGLVSLALCMLGRLRESREALEQAKTMASAFVSPRLRLHHLLLESNLFLAERETQRALDTLAEGLGIADEHGLLKGYIWAPELMATLCAAALEAGVEAGQARRIVCERALLPPAGYSGEGWPWHLKVRVLGSVEVLVRGRVLHFDGKAQKKPLELLRALVAAGPTGVDSLHLADQLWPDSEGDAATSNLRMSLHRLRRLLGDERIVLVEEGRLRLDALRVWSDAWAFDAACGALDAQRTGAGAIQLETLDRILGLYRGDPLKGLTSQPWSLVASERWRSRFVRAVDDAGKLFEARADWSAAARVYQRALEAEPLCERFYQGLMRAQIGADQPDEARQTYLRCSTMLAAAGSTSLSPTTEQLRALIERRNAA